MLHTLSVRKKQIKRLIEMLSLNPNDSLPDWKFIIYDSTGRDILDSLFSNKELRSHYVTLRLPITSYRDPVPDPISAVYFVTPTEENLRIICQDLANNLYDSYYFNFINSIHSEDQLEQLVEAAKSSNAICDVMRVKSEYLDFISMEDDYFVLKESERDLVSYYAINRSDSSDDEITQVIDRIVEGLFSVLVTLNVIPVIRCPTGGPAEVIAEKLTNRLRESLKKDKELLTKAATHSKSSNARPLLCLVDRTVDMSTPLHHTWTYQALIHDLLSIKLNNVEVVEEKDNHQNMKPQFFDLNQGDRFWAEHRGSPFPQVAEAVQQALDEYRKHEDEVRKVKPSKGMDETHGKATRSVADKSGQSSTQMNVDAPSLPELLETKRIIGMHTSIATAVLGEIKSRKLDNFFEIEEKIMNRNPIDKTTLDEMLSDPDYGQPNDKYRLFLISYICDNPALSEDEAERYFTILENLGCKKSAFEYIRRWKSFSNINVASLQSSLKSSSGILKTAGMFTKLMSQGSQFVMEGVKNLVLKEHHLPLTKIVDGLMDCSSKTSREAIDYAYFDPKFDEGSQVQRRRIFQDAIVFVVGGGNYIEYQNLVDYCKSASRNNYGTKNIIYGATDNMNASQFLSQLHQLGTLIDDQ